MRRRDFVAYGSAGALTAAFVKQQFDQQAQAQSASVISFDLHMEEIYEEMIDGDVMFAMAYRDPVTRALRPPPPPRARAPAGAATIRASRSPRPPYLPRGRWRP